MSAEAFLPVFESGSSWKSKKSSHSVYSFTLHRCDIQRKTNSKERYLIRTLPLPPEPDSKKCHFAGVLETYQPNPDPSTDAGPIREDKPVYIKWAYDKKGIDDLSREASMYTTHLRDLQGSVIPKFYGNFVDNIEDPKVACLVLEYIPNRGFEESHNEYCRLFMLTICKLHSAGVIHNALGKNNERHVLACKDGPRIVDFKLAKLHDCLGGTPVPYGEYHRILAATEEGHFCKELMDAEFGCGFHSDSEERSRKVTPALKGDKEKYFTLI